jgi:hypothetical protein
LFLLFFSNLKPEIIVLCIILIKIIKIDKKIYFKEQNKIDYSIINTTLFMHFAAVVVLLFLT